MTHEGPRRSPWARAVTALRQQWALPYVVLVLVTAALSGWNIWSDYFEDMRAAEAELRTLARAAEMPITRALIGIDRLLRDAAATLPEGAAAAGSAYGGMLLARTAAMPDVTGLAVIDGDGTVRVATVAAELGAERRHRPDVSRFLDRDDGEDALVLVRPAAEPGLIYAARPVRGPDRRVRAVVTVSLSARLIDDVLAEVRPTFPGGVAEVIGREATVLGHEPAAWSGDGINRLVVLRSSSVFPLTVRLSAPMGDVLADWVRHSLANLLAVAANSVVFFTALSSILLAHAPALVPPSVGP